MRLTLHVDYSFRTLLYLAANQGEKVKTQQISMAYGISKNHLVRVIQGLEKAGYVRLSHGRTGGVELAVDPSVVKLGDVVKKMEPNMNLVECFSSATNTCPIVPICELKGVLGEASKMFIASLNEYTLADVAPTAAILKKHVYQKATKSRSKKIKTE